MPPPRRRLAACAVTVLACLPYLTLKVAWLAGSSVGVASTAAASGMHDGRYVVGNLITLGMDLVAIALVLALTFRWGRQLPGWLLVLPVWVAAGLLVPIAVGLPFGLMLQAVVGGAPAPGGNGLAGWVYAVVYGGFVLQAAGILAAFWWYARERWPDRTAGRPPVAGPRVLVAAAVTAGFGMLHVAWALVGPAAGAPGGFETATQRTYLAATGLVLLVGAAATATAGRVGEGRLAALLPVAAWVGAAVTVFAGPTKILLAHDGHVGVVVLVGGSLGTVAGLALARKTFGPGRGRAGGPMLET